MTRNLTGTGLSKEDSAARELNTRLAKMESRILKLEAAVEYIKNCYLTPNVKRDLSRILDEEIK